MDYRLSPAHAQHWPKGERNVTWCSKPQVMTFAELEKMISASCGQEMVILDFGASSDLTEYSQKGNSCVL